MPANDDVTTTRLIVFLCLATLPNTFLVPSNAGSINSFCRIKYLLQIDLLPKMASKNSQDKIRCQGDMLYEKNSFKISVRVNSHVSRMWDSDSADRYC